MSQDTVTTAPERSTFFQNSPELQLLLYCSRVTVPLEIADRVKVLAELPLDWDYLLKIARKHSVIILLYQNLVKICPDAIPSEILKELQQFYRTTKIKNLFATGELLRLLELFQNNNIDAICFKGPPLTQSIYKDISLRKFSDLDFIIPTKDINKAKNLLLEFGSKFRLHAVELSDKEKEGFIRSDRVYKFIRECAYELDYYKDKLIIELHWEVLPIYFGFNLPLSYLKETLVPVKLLNTEVANLSPENNLLLLCGHGTKDCWDKLLRISDIAELIRVNPGLDWELILSEADRRGGTRIVLSGVLLARELLDAPLPDIIVDRIDKDKVIGELVEEAKQKLFLEPEQRDKVIDPLKFHLKTKHRLRDKILYLLRIWFTPTLSDWAVFPRANSPEIFYYSIRIFRMLTKYLGK